MADAIISKAGPGLRRDYVLSLVRGFPAEHAEQTTVDLQVLPITPLVLRSRVACYPDLPCSRQWGSEGMTRVVTT